MRDQFVRGKNFWEAPVSLIESGTWKFMAEKRSLARVYMRRAICNGQTTSLWFDPWMAEGANRLAGIAVILQTIQIGESACLFRIGNGT